MAPVNGRICSWANRPCVEISHLAASELPGLKLLTTFQWGKDTKQVVFAKTDITPLSAGNNLAVQHDKIKIVGWHLEQIYNISRRCALSNIQYCLVGIGACRKILTQQACGFDGNLHYSIPCCRSLSTGQIGLHNLVRIFQQPLLPFSKPGSRLHQAA